MPKLEIDDGRFVRLGDRQAPDLLIDPAAIAAVEFADGGCSVHLAGGQTLQLAATAAAALVKKLSREKVAEVSKPKPKPKTETPSPAKPRRRRARSSDAAPAAEAPPPVSLRASVGNYLSRLLD